jgi:hypothetical protein
MTRQISGLHAISDHSLGLPSGSYLVQIMATTVTRSPRARLQVALRVLEPNPYAGARATVTLSCVRKHLWRVSWFLRDFGYDDELLDRDFVDPCNLKGLRGVVRISRQPSSNGEVRLLASARADAWPSQPAVASTQDEVAS